MTADQTSKGLGPKQMMELDACTRCGECVRVCDSYGAAGNEAVVVKGMIQKRRSFFQRERSLLARLLGRRHPSPSEVEGFVNGVFNCTLCARCLQVCPVHIKTRDLCIALREDIAASGQLPANLNVAREAIAKEHNVFNYPQEERATWVDYMEDVPSEFFDKEQAEVLYFVGCISAFSPAIQEVPQAFLSVMLRAGVDVMTLGCEERCCGFPLIVAGLREDAEALREYNLEALRRTGARRMVFNCPSCYHTWHHFYQPPGVELLHSTEFLARLVEEGKITFREMSSRIAYHDPCDLGRGMGVFDPPREVLGSIPGVELVELAESHEGSFCCGGGGDAEIVSPDIVKKINSHLVKAAEATGAELLVCACPQCRRTTQNGIKENNSALRNLDITELVAQIGIFAAEESPMQKEHS